MRKVQYFQQTVKKQLNIYKGEKRTTFIPTSYHTQILIQNES